MLYGDALIMYGWFDGRGKVGVLDVRDDGDVDWVDDMEGILRISDALNPRGCGFVFKEFKLVKEILKKARMLHVPEYERVRASLIPEPSHRGYTNGVPDDNSRWVLEGAREAAAAHADDEVLLDFYQSIIDRELRDQEFHKEHYQNTMLAMA